MTKDSHLDPKRIKTPPREVEINNILFKPIEGVQYRYRYWDIEAECLRTNTPFEEQIAKIICNDLFFIVYFILRIPSANHPYVINACREVELGPDSDTLDLWHRESYKSTIITVAETIQSILRNPEERIGIFSFSQRAALSLFRTIKQTFETSELLKICFPHTLYANPESEAFKWSDESGLYVRRQSVAREATLEAWSLLEGQPIGKHFTKIVYDDVETDISVSNPDTAAKLIQAFEMSLNLGSDGFCHRVVGTTYAHYGLLEHLKAKKLPDGSPLYHTRVKPATEDGSFNGKSVLLSEKRLAHLRTNRRTFYSQQLLNPTPSHDIALDQKLLQDIEPSKIPEGLFKFMTIDGAGDRKATAKRESDSWAFAVCGVVPRMDDLGLSDLYILDLHIEPMDIVSAMKTTVDIYRRNGRILKLGIEKVGMSSTEIHVTNTLRASGIHVSLESGSLAVVSPRGRSKETRIEQCLAWPLSNSRIWISTAIPEVHRSRLRLEMEKFPFWHDDGLDAIAYQYDLIKEYRFGTPQAPAKPKPIRHRRIGDSLSNYSWMSIN